MSLQRATKAQVPYGVHICARRGVGTYFARDASYCEMLVDDEGERVCYFKDTKTYKARAAAYLRCLCDSKRAFVSYTQHIETA